MHLKGQIFIVLMVGVGFFIFLLLSSTTDRYIPEFAKHIVAKIRDERKKDFADARKTFPTPDIARIYLNDTDTAENDFNVSENLLCKSKPDFEDFNFTCYEKCSDSIQVVRNISFNLEEVCSNLEEENITKTNVSDGRYIFTVPYNSTCLKHLKNAYCNSSFRVPNIIHYIWFTKHKMEYMHFLSFMSVMKIQKPCLVFIHADFLPFGIFWNHTLHFINNLVHVYVEPPKTIHGRELGCVEHKADVHRLRCVHDFGGMYFDIDQILLKSLDPLRNYSFTQSLEIKGFNLANSLLISVPNAEFVNIWLDNYRTYNKTQWAYHSTMLPFKLSQKYPDLIHIESDAFIKPNFNGMKLIFDLNYNWITNYALHIYVRFYGRKHNLNDIRKLNTTIGSMSRYVLYGSKELCFNL